MTDIGDRSSSDTNGWHPWLSVTVAVSKILTAEVDKSIGATVVTGAVSGTAVVNGTTVGIVLVAVATVNV